MAQMTVQPGAVSERQFDIKTITNIAGAAISVALLVGVGVWGYKLLVRDVSGVPVVQATDGPSRVQPQDPGGAEIQHQGLAVNDVAAEGAAARPADRLVLAPEPLTLSVEDTPQEVATTIATTQSENTSATVEAVEPVQTAAATTEQTTLDLVERLAEGAEPLLDLQPATLPEDDDTASVNRTPVAELIEEAQEATVSEGLARSLRPQARPTRVASIEEAVAASVAASSNSAPEAVDPATVPVGTRMAQLGAFESAEVAQQEWLRLSQTFSEYLVDKQQVIQRAQSGGRTFYRLRAMGFADLSDARRFCSALVSEKAECIPVVTR